MLSEESPIELGGDNGNNNDDDDFRTTLVERGVRIADNDSSTEGTDERYKDHPVLAEAYKVSDAEPVLAQDVIKESTAVRTRRLAAASLTCLFVVGLVVGLSVGLTNRNEDDKNSFVSARPPDDSDLGRVEARVVSETYKDSGKMVYFEATRYSGGTSTNHESVTVGSFRFIHCNPLACVANYANCRVDDEVYKVGCCAGAECNEENKCGRHCPAAACKPTHPDCISDTCVSCEKGADGEELYIWRNIEYEVDCLNTGYGTNKNDGAKYAWAIMCMKCVQGCVESQNTGRGEYDCVGLRRLLPGEVSEEIPSDSYWVVPCQLIQLGECGCAPPDVIDFGLGTPEKACRTTDDCPILCDDAGPDAAKNICNAFPGNIAWWEGTNFAERNMFNDSNDPEQATSNFDIHIYDIDPP